MILFFVQDHISVLACRRGNKNSLYIFLICKCAFTSGYFNSLTLFKKKTINLVFLVNTL